MFYYKKVIAGQITTVEAKNKPSISPGFVVAKKSEYEEYIASLPEPQPSRNLAAEIDELKTRLDNLEVKEIN